MSLRGIIHASLRQPSSRWLPKHNPSLKASAITLSMAGALCFSGCQTKFEVSADIKHRVEPTYQVASNVYRIHDSEKEVTCWYYSAFQRQAGISCLPDSSIKAEK